MNNALILMQLLNALIAAAANTTLTIQRISAVLTKAHQEGRDVTDEELKAIADESDQATKAALAELDAAALKA